MILVRIESWLKDKLSVSKGKLKFISRNLSAKT